MELFVQLNVLCLGNWLHAPLRKSAMKFLYFPFSTLHGYSALHSY